MTLVITLGGCRRSYLRGLDVNRAGAPGTQCAACLPQTRFGRRSSSQPAESAEARAREVAALGGPDEADRAGICLPKPLASCQVHARSGVKCFRFKDPERALGHNNMGFAAGRVVTMQAGREVSAEVKVLIVAPTSRSARPASFRPPVEFE